MTLPSDQHGYGSISNLHRRAAITTLVSGAVIGSVVRASSEVSTPALHAANWFNVKSDFNARGNGVFDDTDALQNSIKTGSENQRPVFVPPGCYKITRTLNIPSNTMLVGSSPGLGFGCRIEPLGCAAFAIGGKKESFHCSIENLMLWPKGDAPECVLSIDNSYSITFRNLRIHDSQQHLTRAAILLLGDSDIGGHGRCNNIIWDNLIVRNDNAQPPVAILAAKGCGSHRFINPCLENFGTLSEWQGGQIDLITPYTERAGRYGVNCNIDPTDNHSYLNTFGGSINTANSGLGCAIRATTKNFNSFGTRWGDAAERAAYVYELPRGPVNFHGLAPNTRDAGTARFSGIPGWRNHVNFITQILKTSKSVNIEVPAGNRVLIKLNVPGVSLGEYWVRPTINADLNGVQVQGYVSEVDKVTVVLSNAGNTTVRVSGELKVECGLV